MQHDVIFYGIAVFSLSDAVSSCGTGGPPKSYILSRYGTEFERTQNSQRGRAMLASAAEISQDPGACRTGTSAAMAVKRRIDKLSGAETATPAPAKVQKSQSADMKNITKHLMK